MWERRVWQAPEDGSLGRYERAETDLLEPPERNAGWYLVSAPAVGKVSGAGEAPSRSGR